MSPQLFDHPARVSTPINPEIMCNQDEKNQIAENGLSLDDQQAHQKDHQAWSRRQFLLTGGLASLGAVTLGGMPVRSVMPNAFISAMSQCQEDRTLVLLRLFGGNDGLNTVIPHTDAVGRDKYMEFRPGLGRSMNDGYDANTVLNGYGTPDFALPTVMQDIMPLWNEGKMAVIHNVGYPKQNFSHFTSSNLWATGADDSADQRYSSGWMGRELNQTYPSFTETPPSVPPALQIGFTNNLLFKNENGVSMELVFRNPDEFYRLAQEGRLYSTSGLGSCPRDSERFFLRQMANNSFRYSETVAGAYNRSENRVSYPQNTNSNLSGQLSIVSRLIKGQLGTKVYMVYINGFDTHALQSETHNGLLMNVAQSVKAFFDDLKADGYEKDVALMTFSEFGRTVVENGSQGTDHGNMSPLFVIGDGVQGGFYGTPMDLDDDDIPLRKRVYFENQPSIDYRSVYQSVFQDWMGVDPNAVRYILGDEYAGIDQLFKDPCSPSIGSNGVAMLLGHRPADMPNQFEIAYALSQPGNVRLQIFDGTGQRMGTLFRGYRDRGTYTFSFDPSKYNIKEGLYTYRLDASGRSYSRKIIIQ